MIGETIKDFTITAQLGRGGMGEVFVGEQKLVKTKVAIKMLRSEISAEKAHVDRFFNEAIAVSKIKHAGIVKIFDVGFHQGRAYLVMEFLDGEPLSQRLRKSLSFPSAIDIARQITSVLDATHAAGITHRDLKPDNVFLVPDAEIGERVRILDFGIAKLGDVNATATAMSMGTPAYMAPELWRDAATSGPPTDVYALGCLLFELCSARPPFPVTAVSEACGKHLTEIPPRLQSLRPDVPEVLDDLIARMLEKAPADRPTTKQIASTLAALQTAGVAASAPRFSKEMAAVAPTTPSGGSAPATAIGHGDMRDPAISDEDVALAARYETEKRWMDLVKLLGRQVDAVQRANKPALYLRIAAIYQDRFANMAEAMKAYERVLEYESENRRALEQLRALYEKRRDWEKLLELEKGELDRTDPEKRADKAVDVARLAASRVGKAEVTIYWWQRVLDYEPDHRQALAELVKSFERAGRPSELASVLQHQAEIAQGNDDRIAALRRLAEVQEDLLGDRHAARDSWQQLLDTDPNDGEAKRALERLGMADSAPPANATAPAKAAAAGSTRSPEPTTAAALAKPAAAGSTRAPDPAAATDVAKKSSTGKIALGVGALALAAGTIYFVTRSPKADPVVAVDALREAPKLDAAAATDAVASVVDAAVSADPTQASVGGLVLSYRVLSRPAAGGEFRAVKLDDQLRTDDRIAFEVRVSEQAHVYLGQRAKGKRLSVVFPQAGIDVANPLPANTWVRIPTGEKSFRLNNLDIGTETVYFVAARAPVQSLAAAIELEGKAKAPTAKVEEQLVQIAMEKRADCVGTARAVVLDGDGPCKVKERGVVLDDDQTAKPARRVRGTTADDVIFVPFSFQHVAGAP